MCRHAAPACRTPKAPLGYSLKMFAWYIDQTVGGAVATGTHGSSLKWGSLSSQVQPPIYLALDEFTRHRAYMMPCLHAAEHGRQQCSSRVLHPRSDDICMVL